MGLNKDCALKGCLHLEVKHQELEAFIYPYYQCPHTCQGLTALYPPQKGEKDCPLYEAKEGGTDDQ